MILQFNQLADLDLQSASTSPDALWSIVIDQSIGDYTCQVHKRKDEDFFFRVLCDFESSAEETFVILY